MADRDDDAAAAFLAAIMARAAEQLAGDESVWNEDVERYGPVTSGKYGSPDGWSHTRAFSDGVVGSWTLVTFAKDYRVDVHILGGFEGFPPKPASIDPGEQVFEPGPEDVVAAGVPIPVVDVVVPDDVPDVDPEPVERRPADVRSAESVRADDLRRHRERLASSEGWRPWRGRSW